MFSDVREMEANRGDVRRNVRYVSVNVGEEEANRGDVRSSVDYVNVKRG